MSSQGRNADGRIVRPAEHVRPVGTTRAILGEGPLWVARENAVYWTDIRGRALHRLMLDSLDQASWEMPDTLCWIVERQGGPGFLAGFAREIATLQLDPLDIVPLAAPEPELPHNRLNDAAVDRWGRVWAGTMDDREESASGALYRVDRAGDCTRVDTGYVVSNGPTFSPDHSLLYHTDTTRRVIYRFSLDDDGGLSDRSTFVAFPDDWGCPDGMATDTEGGIWVAHWGGGRLSRFLPSGLLDRVISLPVAQVTSCCFAGPDLDRMFVTTASIGHADDELAGSVFEVFPGVSGVPCHAYAG
jgi:sugar lactone lactonase YvrE